MPFGPASRLGVSLFDETPPMEWMPGRSTEEIDTLIKAVYRQVLGNAYVMESERLAVPESQFKSGEFSVREFVRAVAKSALYQDRFFTNVPRYRYIELTYRHLLGRAPNSYDDMKMHSAVLDTEGFEADIIMLDPDTPWQIDGDRMAALAGNTPFDRLPVQGRVRQMMKGGKVL